MKAREHAERASDLLVHTDAHLGEFIGGGEEFNVSLAQAHALTALALLAEPEPEEE